MHRTSIAFLSAGIFALACFSAPASAQHHMHGHESHGGTQEAAPMQTPWGIAGAATNATRTISVAMRDSMRFVPDTIAVKQGETIRFVLRNEGIMLHEFVLGTKDSLDELADVLLKGAEVAHDKPYMLHVEPGTLGELVWTFNRAGRFYFGCLIAGHYQAGMVGTVNVAARTSGASAESAKP